MWDCPKCGALGIMGLPNCPQCGAARPEGDVVSVTVLPAEDVSAAPVAGPPDSLAGEDADGTAASPEPQTPKKAKASAKTTDDGEPAKVNLEEEDN
jgi:hypothetical protein